MIPEGLNHKILVRALPEFRRRYGTKPYLVISGNNESFRVRRADGAKEFYALREHFELAEGN